MGVIYMKIQEQYLTVILCVCVYQLMVNGGVGGTGRTVYSLVDKM